MIYYYWLIKKDTHEQSDTQDAAQKFWSQVQKLLFPWSLKCGALPMHG